MKFSTKDQDNDFWPDVSCATNHKAAWWYHWCTNANLNGYYFVGGITDDDGVCWYLWRGSWYSYKYSEMKIRPSYV